MLGGHNTHEVTAPAGGTGSDLGEKNTQRVIRGKHFTPGPNKVVHIQAETKACTHIQEHTLTHKIQETDFKNETSITRGLLCNFEIKTTKCS